MSANLAVAVEIYREQPESGAGNGDAAEEPEPSDRQLERWATTAFSAPCLVNLPRSLSGNTEVKLSIAILGPERMRALNREFRNKDKTTNVLAFPSYQENESQENESIPPSAELLLGDIILCPEVINAEAQSQQKKMEDHWAHMVVHGALHLLGYDHELQADAEQMEDTESDLLATLGIPNPYQAMKYQDNRLDDQPDNQLDNQLDNPLDNQPDAGQINSRTP